MALPAGPGAFWQWWAIAGIVILGATFWWFSRFVGAPLTLPAGSWSQIIDGLWRFSLLILTPAAILCWLAAGWLRTRAGARFYWTVQGWIMGVWSICVAGVLLASGA